jgi:AcrR family transcriptional regulator
VLDAAYRLLIAHGLENLSITRVAEKSGIHETTIYRRWKTVNALALDACLQGLSIAAPVPERGSLEADLIALVQSLVKLFDGPDGKALLDICRIAAPEVAQARAELIARRVAIADVVFDRAASRGEWDDSFDRGELLELLVAPIFMRALVSHQPLRALPVAAIVRTLLAGARSRR